MSENLIKVRNRSETCLAIGAGAIGKSVTGVIFRNMGFNVTFADVSEDVIRDIKRRSGYKVLTTGFNMPDVWSEVTGIDALSIFDDETKKSALNADYICTSIGPLGLKAFMPTLTEWINLRDKYSDKMLYLIFFENESKCVEEAELAIKEKIGFIPNWLKIAKASIERMTKPLVSAEGEYNVVAEKVYPVFLPKNVMKKSSIAKENQIKLVENIDAYYYRKLFTNNLGHAALGYIGSYYGYDYCMQTLKDEQVSLVMRGAIKQSGEMLIKAYGFSETEMKKHTEELPERYWNQGLNDSLLRLARDPLRKLESNERIIGAIRKCEQYKVECSEIIKVLCYALSYYREDDDTSYKLKEIREEKGIGFLLENICCISKEEVLYRDILNKYNDLNLN